MRHVPSDKYNVAWFKLAEFVARGEKERALALYRLLAHSFDDMALAHQLEGHLLLSFNDEMAIEKFHAAAQLFRKQGRLAESAAVYEQLIDLSPDNICYLLDSLPFYKQLHYPCRLGEKLKQAHVHFMHQGAYQKMVILLEEYDAFLSQEEKSVLYQDIVLDFIKHAIEPEIIEVMINRILDVLIAQDQTPVLQQFLTRLEMMNPKWYEYTTKLLSA